MTTPDPVAQALAALRTPQGSADPYPHLAVLRELSPCTRHRAAVSC